MKPKKRIKVAFVVLFLITFISGFFESLTVIWVSQSIKQNTELIVSLAEQQVKCAYADFTVEKDDVVYDSINNLRVTVSNIGDGDLYNFTFIGIIESDSELKMYEYIPLNPKTESDPLTPGEEYTFNIVMKDEPVPPTAEIQKLRIIGLCQGKFKVLMDVDMGR